MTGYKANLKDVCGCEAWVQGETTDELVTNIKKHAKDTHGINEIPNELSQKLMKAIQPV
jgi:predicted small metal-binding protein